MTLLKINFSELYSKHSFIIKIFLFFLLIAYLSKGWFQPDEHFQILEFMNYKLQNNPNIPMVWEFHEKIRPWLMPAFFTLIKLIIHFKNPLTEALFYRIISSMLFLTSFFYLFSSLKPFFEEKKLKIIIFSSIAFLWVTPFFAARTSSENYAQIFSLFAFSALLNSIYEKNLLNLNKIFQNFEYKKCTVFFTGMLFGIAFECRFQIIFLVLFVCLWFFLNVKRKILFFNLLSGGFFSILFLSLFIDKWGYGQYVFPPYLYFYSNLIEGVANEFGTSPFYGYFIDPLTSAFIPIYILYIWILVLCIKQKKWNLFIFSTLPFYIVHFIISHKEGRFLIPITILTGIPVFSYFYDIYNTANKKILEKTSKNLHLIKRELQYKNILKIGLIIYFIIQAILLISNLIDCYFIKSHPKYYDFLYKNNFKNKTIYAVNDNLFGPGQAFFYDNNNYILIHESAKESEFEKIKNKPSKFYLLYFNEINLMEIQDHLIMKNNKCKIIFRSSPISNEYFQNHPIFTQVFINSSLHRMYQLFSCERLK